MPRRTRERTVTGRTILRHLLAAVAVASLIACSNGNGGSPSTAGTGGTSAGGTGALGGTSAGGVTGGTQSGGTQSGGASPTGGALAGGAGFGGVAGAGVAGSSGSGGAMTGAAGSGGNTAGNGGAGGYVPSGPCSPPVDAKRPAEKLSETGCMDPNDLTKMADFVIPYDVNSPLWSDAAVKTRGMVIPQGKKIHVKNCAANPDECLYGPEDDGRWDFPLGTVLVKNFLFDGKLVETRLFVNRDTRKWFGYSYQWNEAQTEATIVPDEARAVMFNTGQRQVPWTYPSRYDCGLCHNRPGGYALGPETRQLNRMMGGENLLDRLERLALFDAPLPKPYLAPLVTPYESPEGRPPTGTPTEELARSYMHANCSFCHRADGNPGTLDLRYGVSLANMNACNVQPQKGGAGLTTYSILTPGKPQESVMSARVQTLDDKDRMPQIATYVVDDQGLKLINDWITGIPSCSPSAP